MTNSKDGKVTKVEMNSQLAHILANVFDNDNGRFALEYFEKSAKKGKYPDYDNVYRQYGIAGMLQQINFIRSQVDTAV